MSRPIFISSQINKSQVFRSNVRGIASRNDTINPTTPNTIEQVACLVVVFMATVKVNKWLAMIKTRYIMLLQNNSSRPNRPMINWPASAALEM
jgi:hypothetical protein